MAVRQLTAEEEAKPYAGYYHRPLTPPDPDLMAQIRPDAQTDPALALPPERISDLLDPGYHEVETGWCVMPNGSGYLAVHNRMPGVTVEMLDWWFSWHSMASLRYGLWYPPGHYGISISKKSRARLPRPRCAGQAEDLRPHRPRGRGHRHGRRGHLHQLLRPRADGLRHEPLPRAERRGAVRRVRLDQPQGAEPSDIRAPAIMCHFIREIQAASSSARGSGWATRLSTGNRCWPSCRVNGAARRASGFAEHNVREYCNLKSLLPEIWAEFKDADPAL